MALLMTAGQVWGLVAGGSALDTLAPGVKGQSLGAGVAWTPRSDLESATPGEVEVIRVPVVANYRYSRGPGGFLNFSAGYEYADYDWTQADLFDETQRVSLSAVGLRRIPDSRWGIFGFGQVSWAAEMEGVSLGRGFSATTVVGPAYSFSRNLSVTGAILANVQPERDPRFFPVAAVNWRINEQWSLRTLNGAIVSYLDPDNRYQLDFSGEYRTRGIRLRRQALPDGTLARPAVEEREIAVGAGAAWRLADSVVVTAFAEYLFEREWRFYHDDRSFRTVTAESAPQLGLRLDWVF